MKATRASCVLLHPTSLPGDFGIGDLGPEALRFLDWLAAAGQTYWQVLPLGPTGFGDSPYAPLSSFAGNELLISPEVLAGQGLISADELAAARVPPGVRVDYGTVIPARKALVRAAAKRFLDTADTGTLASFTAFKRENSFWLDDYALFIDIKEEYDGKAAAAGVEDSSWNEYWPRPLALRDPEALTRRRRERSSELELSAASQFLFFSQWRGLREAAAERGIGFIGDLPIFVAMDSADAWARPELFRLDARGRPIERAGVPPDYFSEDGQLWGNPLYAWEKHEAEGFSWWLSRVETALRLYDRVRIDHFRGLEAYWAVPAGDRTARRGTWRKAPGRALLEALSKRLDGLGGEGMPIIAEDLGFITDEVRSLLRDFSLPGMRILQFAFDSREFGTLDPANPFLPHNYRRDAAVYTGTHDNDTLAARLAEMSPKERAFMADYLGYEPADPVWALIREAEKSVADLAVIPMQDVLGLGAEARMNTPSTVGGNWSWRMLPGQADPALAARMAELARVYGR